MRRPKHTTPPKHLTITFNPHSGLYDVYERYREVADREVYSMPLELIRRLAVFYRYKNCGPDIPPLKNFHKDLSKEERAQVITNATQPKADNDFFPDREPEYE